MTYIVGFKSKDAVFLSADMAITDTSKDQEKIDSYSSFGEQHYQKMRYSVCESANKIFVINPYLAITYSGNSYLATTIVESFKSCYWLLENSKIKDVYEILERAINSSMSEKNIDVPSFIIAFFYNGGPELISYNITKRNAFDSHKYLVQCGSISNFYKKFTIEFYKKQISQEATNRTRLIILNSILQSYGLHDRGLIEEGVGGCFIGIGITCDGMFWQDDTIYVIYERAESIKYANVIKAIARDNTIAISSPYLTKKSIYINSLNTNLSDWLTNWRERIFNDLNDLESLYYCFLEKNLHKIVLLSLKQKSLKNSKYLKLIRRISENRVEMGISPELYKYLMYDCEQTKEGHFPIHFHLLCE